MTATASEVISMGIFFTSKKKQAEIDRQQAVIVKEQMKKEAEIQSIKAATAEQAQAATDSLRQLNELVERHGASGILLVAMGGGRK